MKILLKTAFLLAAGTLFANAADAEISDWNALVTQLGSSSALELALSNDISVSSSASVTISQTISLDGATADGNGFYTI